MEKQQKSIAIIIPVFNEVSSIEKSLLEIIQQSTKVSEYDINILLVDDGSTDQSVAIIKKIIQHEKDISLLCLNRNFGKEAAIQAGLNSIKKCHAAIIMDSDLEHPPSLIKKMICKWEEGYEVVEACKLNRGKETFFSKILVKTFYTLFDGLTDLNMKNQSDFKLLDKIVIKTYCDLYEQGRFFRGLINWMNFSTEKIYFNVTKSNKSKSSWNKWGLFKYAVSSITSFSSLPLHLVTLMGLVSFILSFVMGTIALFDKISGQAVDGFTTVILLILIIGSILMMSVGIIGIYIAKIYDEVKHRPTYIIDSKNSLLNKNL